MTLELRGNPETGRIRWTRRAVRALADSGVIDLEAFELLEGELLHKVKNPPHILAFVLSLQRLTMLFGMLYCQPEGPIEVALSDDETNLPEPDIAVLSRPLSATRPGPAEVRLLLEIADSTLSRDLGSKARLYARAGIVEYWVLDIENRRLHVHRDPAGDLYGSVRRYEESEEVAPLAAPTSPIAVSELLPPAAS
jgi:Uma2 family endonuclease